MAEQRKSLKALILLSFFVFISVLGMLFAMQAKSALEGFDRWVGHEDHRMPNIRLVPEACRWAVIERFIDVQPVDSADAFIFGDSQMFARGATQEEIFYTQWLGPEARVINFSFLAASISDMAKIADELHRRDVSVPMTLQNVNLTHYVLRPEWEGLGAEISEKASERAARLIAQLDTRPLLPDRPKGISQIYKNRYVCAFRMRKEFSQDKLRTARYRKLLTTFNKVKLPDYFVSFYDEGFYYIVPPNIKSFENISPRTIFITAPMAYDKFELYDFDAKNLDDFAFAFHKFCHKHPKIECHNFNRSITSEGFMDLIHMNAVGHKLLGQELARIVPEF